MWSEAAGLSTWLDLSWDVNCCGEKGLLSFAFHPDFANNGRAYVYYSQGNLETVISEFSVLGDPLSDPADSASEVLLLTENEPAGNHNGGQIAFGPDGMLYIGLGDGGGAGALLPSDKVTAGFSLQGRDTYYPGHLHLAEESYWVIGGAGDWKVGTRPWFAVKPGDSIYHETGMRHTMQTNEQAMLTVWLWTSHLDSEVVIVRG